MAQPLLFFSDFLSLSATVPVLFAVIVVYSFALLWINPARRIKLRYPPGPPAAGYFSGNTSQMPQSQAWLVYTDWAKVYGDIIHFTMYGEHTIILNKMEDTIELFEKRSGLYSDRKQSTMTKLMGWGFNVGLLPYGNEWRGHRKSMKKHLENKSLSTYTVVQTEKTHRLLKDLLNTPDDFRKHLARLPTAIVMSILYGFDISDERIDYFAHLSEVATGKLGETMIPGAAVVDALPFLQYVPGWVPGAQFQHYAAYVKQFADRMLDEPIHVVKERVMQGTAGACVAAELLESCNDEKEQNKVAGLTATLYAAGSDTLSSAFSSFFLAMTLNPTVQRRAQSEIDQATLREQLPSFEDRPSLAYIDALIRELLRWRPPLCLNVPHQSSDEDVYKGYYIPKGTVLVANIWAMSRDEDVYPNPEEFKPERFLNADGSLKQDDEFIITFGYGRRICPGMHLALGTLYIMVASVLATFDIRQKKGAEVTADLPYTDGMITHPGPFECSVTPRDEIAAKLVREC